MPLERSGLPCLAYSRRICGIVVQGTVRPVTCVRKSRCSYLGYFQTCNSVLIVSAECFFELFINCITLALTLILILVNNCALWRSLNYTTRKLILGEGKEILWLEQKVPLWQSHKVIHQKSLGVFPPRYTFLDSGRHKSRQGRGFLLGALPEPASCKIR